MVLASQFLEVVNTKLLDLQVALLGVILYSKSFSRFKRIVI